MLLYVHGKQLRFCQDGQGPRLQNFFMLNSSEIKIYPAHKC